VLNKCTNIIRSIEIRNLDKCMHLQATGAFVTSWKSECTYNVPVKIVEDILAGYTSEVQLTH